MTSSLVSVIDVYAKQMSVTLALDWAAKVPQETNPKNANAIDLISKSLGWVTKEIKGKPRAHHLPALVFHPNLGWCVAESWVTKEKIRISTSRETSEILWSEILAALHIEFTDFNKTSRHQKAIDVFWSAILRRKSLIFDAFVATCIINVIGLATAIYSMQVYDRVIPRGGFDTLIVLTSGMLFVLIIDALIRNSRSVMMDRDAGVIDSEVSEYFYDRMQAVRLDARPKSIGTMAAQLRGTEQIRSVLSSASILVLADLPFALLFIVGIAWVGGVVVTVPLVAFTLSLLLAAFMARNIRTDARAAQISGNKKNGLLVEALDASETIKASLAGWHMLANWNRLVEEVFRHDLKVKRWSALSGSGFSLIQQLAYVGVVFVGAFEVARGNMTMGGVIACSILSGRVSGPLVAALPNLIVQWSYAQTALQALDNILTMPSDQPTERPLLHRSSVQGDLVLEDVKFTYQGSKSGISVPNLTIKMGEWIGIIGPVGSGKSTFLKILSGLYATQEGRTLLDGVDVRQIAQDDLRRHLLYFPQNYRLVTGTLRENVTLGLPFASDDMILDAAQKTGLNDLIQSHPMGLDLPISEGGNDLSAGQRVLVGLTRLLLTKPKILLLDEPTANLDQETENRVLRAIAEFAKSNCTVVFVTHKSVLLGLVKRVIVISKGRIALDGPSSLVREKLKSKASPAPDAVQRIVLEDAGNS